MNQEAIEVQPVYISKRAGKKNYEDKQRRAANQVTGWPGVFTYIALFPTYEGLNESC